MLTGFPQERLLESTPSSSSITPVFVRHCLFYDTVRNMNDRWNIQEYFEKLETKELRICILTEKRYLFGMQTVIIFFIFYSYLGDTISEDLKWKTHINNICICYKPNSTLVFLGRNLRHSSKTYRNTTNVNVFSE